MALPRRAASLASAPPFDDTIPRCLRAADARRPHWLLTLYASNTWVVSDTGDKPDRTLRFDIGLPSGGKLSDRPTQLESVKRVIFGTRHGPLTRIGSGSVQAERVNSLLTLVRWMDINRIERFADLTASDQWEYAHLAVGGANEILNTEGILARHLQALAERAEYREADSLEDRRQKSMRALPVRSLRGDQVELDRDRLMVDAGLDGVRLASGAAALQALDQFDLASGLDVSALIRKRAAQHLDLDIADGRQLTTEAVRRLLMPFVLLHEHRRYLDDALEAKPFEGQALKDIAKRLGSDIGRTRTIPMKQAATLIERSVRWVLDYASPILDAKEATDTGESPEEALTRLPSALPASPFPLKRAQRNERIADGTLGSARPVVPGTGMSLYVALQYLGTACGIVIAAFSARRAAEVIGLQDGCIERDDTGAPWLRSFVYKTFQSYGTVPVPEVVAAAVEVLVRLSARARHLTGSAYLFQFNIPGSDRVVGLSADGAPVFRLGSLTREFGYFVDVPPLPDGARWTFHPHQFRRFFAVLYVWCYELADWGALAYHLRHFNLEMTRRYVTDSELGGILHQADRERTAEILARVAMGNTHLAGAAGHRLENSLRGLYGRLAQKVQVVPERKVQQRIGRFVERSNLTLKALPWGYCASPDAIGVATQCTGGTGPAVPAEATVSTCVGCARNVRSAEFAPHVERMLSQHRALAASPAAPPLLRRASEALCRDVEAYLLDSSREPTVPRGAS